MKIVEMNILSVLKAPSNPQDIVPEIRQELGEPLGPPMPPVLSESPPVDPDNTDDNSAVDLNQPNPILEAIDVINVPVPELLPDGAPDAAAPQVLGTAGENSNINTDIPYVNDCLGTPTVVVHDTNWFEDNL